MAIRQDASTGKMVEDGEPLSPEPIDSDTLHVKVYSPFHTYYNDSAKSLSAVNETGPFDVLPKHHKFISLLEPCELVIATLAGGTQKIKIAGGILHVRSNELSVLLDV